MTLSETPRILSCVKVVQVGDFLDCEILGSNRDPSHLVNAESTTNTFKLQILAGETMTTSVLLPDFQVYIHKPKSLPRRPPL